MFPRTHITSDMCSHITSDMCSPGGETHDTEAMYPSLIVSSQHEKKWAAGASDKNIQVCKFVKFNCIWPSIHSL